ncbi:hypothetical protein Angca_002235 [Angiostrongylus cantonensis]|nr:hypothetical protein Angca_002235 [Angiostrongylus cantonensis]
MHTVLSSFPISSRTKMREQLSRLTPQQHKRITETFKLIDNDPVKSALRMLLKLFTEHPQYKHIWPQFRQIPDSSLMNAVQLRRHASVYMAGLRNIIHSMSNEDELILQMIRIAKAHKKWNIHRRHVMTMLQPLLETLQESNNGQMDEELKTAWTTFFDVIADFIEIYRN